MKKILIGNKIFGVGGFLCMKKIFLPLLLLIFFVTGCGGGQDSKNVNSSKFSGTLVIGIDDEYAPFGFRDKDGELIGFDIDLAKEAAKRMGVKFEFKPINWNNKENELDSGNIDIIWNGLDITPEREERILYTKPYMDNRQILLAKKSNDFNLRTEHDLEGKIVGTQAGSNSEDYIAANETLMNSFKDFKTYATFKQAFLDLSDGKVDVLIVDELAGRYEMSKIPRKFEIIEITIGPVTEIGIGFRKSDVELRDRVQKVFDDMVRDGTAKKISEQWFQADLIKYKR